MFSLPNEFSSYAELSQVYLVREEERDEMEKYQPSEPVPLPIVKRGPNLPPLGNMKNEHKTRGRIYMTQTKNAWVHRITGNNWPSIITALKGRGHFGERGVANCLSRSRAAQYKAMSTRKASLAPRNAGPSSNTLWATLLSLTILDKRSTITGEQWWSLQGKSHDCE